MPARARPGTGSDRNRGRLAPPGSDKSPWCAKTDVTSRSNRRERGSFAPSYCRPLRTRHEPGGRAPSNFPDHPCLGRQCLDPKRHSSPSSRLLSGIGQTAAIRLRLRLPLFLLTDITQMTSRFAEIIPPYHRRGNCIPFAAIRWPDFGDQPSVGRPFGQICRHSDTPLLSFSPRRRFPRPTPGRILVADHQSGSRFS